MKIQSIKTVYFSATGNTKNVVKLIGETIARNMNLSYKEIDFTLPQDHKDSYEFTKEEQNKVAKAVLKECVWDGETLKITL